MATDYNKLKVTELKEILKERGIPQTRLSRKQQIVDALEKHDAEQGVQDEAPAAVVEEQAEEAEGVDVMLSGDVDEKQNEKTSSHTVQTVETKTT